MLELVPLRARTPKGRRRMLRSAAPALGSFGIMISDPSAFLRLLGSFGFSTKVVSRGPGASNDVLHGCRGFAAGEVRR
jgi:hypothetical protein